MNYRDITCYDPAVPEFSKLPDGKFDIVICTSVLEHIPEDQLMDTIKTIFSKANKFVFFVIHCGLATNLLSDGTNAHCTIYHPKKWK